MAPSITSVTRDRWLALVPLCLVVGAAIVSALLLLRPASVPPAHSITDFSTDSAMRHLRVIAARPRPTGSPGHEEARRYLIRTLRRMGFAPELQSATVVRRWPGSTAYGAGQVDNVLVRIPGTAGGCAVALDAHYDCGPAGSGAGDVGIGVAAVLEILRALRAGPPLRNDVIAVFADAEENGDLGARAFARQHAWARDVCIALNFEGMGNGGAPVMYTTGGGDLALIREFASVAPQPNGTSFARAITRDLMPEQRAGCDLEEYLDIGAEGLGFSINGNSPANHTVLDAPEAVDQRSVAQLGATGLALVRRLGDLDLRQLRTSPPSTYFPLGPALLVAYPERWGFPIALVSTLVLVAVMIPGLRRGTLTPWGLVAGGAALPIGVAIATAAAALLWWGIRSMTPSLRVMLVGSYRTAEFAIALSVIALAIVMLIYALLRAWLRDADLWGGALMTWAGLAIWTSVSLPGMSYLFSWPLLAGALALGASVLIKREPALWQQSAILSIPLAVGVALFVPPVADPLIPYLTRLEALTGLPYLGITALSVAILYTHLFPAVALFDRISRGEIRWTLTVVSLVAGLVLLGFTAVMYRFDGEHPRPDRISYRLDADGGVARWISEDPELDAWTRRFFPPGAVPASYVTPFGDSIRAFSAAAPVVVLAPPEVSVVLDSTSLTARILELAIVSRRGAPFIRVVVTTPGTFASASLDGNPLDVDKLPASGRNRIDVTYAGRSAAAFVLRLALTPVGRVGVVVEDFSDGLPVTPGVRIHPRPSDVMPAPAGPGGADPTHVARRVEL